MNADPSRKLLDANLNPTLDADDARFSEGSHFLEAYIPRLYADVEALYLNDKGNGFPYKDAKFATLHNGEWSDKAGEGFVFTREEGATTSWVTKIGGHTIRILSTCDGRDAAQWVSNFETIAFANPSNPLSKINLLRNAEFILGAFDNNKKNVAGAGARTVSFFNHHGVDRLLACGIEEVTRSNKWKTPTTILNTICHESAHLFEKAIKPEIDLVADLVFTSFSDDKAKETVIEMAMDINGDYLTEIYTDDYKKAPFLDFQKPSLFKGKASLTTLARHTAEEIVSEAFGRFVLGGETWTKEPRSPFAQELMDRLTSITLKPTILPQAGEDTLLSTLEIPTSLPESLSRSVHRNITRPTASELTR
jgi:hypothetical protein